MALRKEDCEMTSTIVPRASVLECGGPLPPSSATGLLAGRRAVKVFTMSKAEILKELPALQPADRREIFDRLCDLQERDLLAGQPPTPEEKALLDRELEDYRKNPNAGSSWEEVEARLRGPSPQ